MIRLFNHPSRVLLLREYLSKASKSFANFTGSARKSALVLKSLFSNFLTSAAGLPAKTELGGTSFVTTAQHQ